MPEIYRWSAAHALAMLGHAFHQADLTVATVPRVPLPFFAGFVPWREDDQATAIADQVQWHMPSDPGTGKATRGIRRADQAARRGDVLGSGIVFGSRTLIGYSPGLATNPPSRAPALV